MRLARPFALTTFLFVALACGHRDDVGSSEQGVEGTAKSVCKVTKAGSAAKVLKGTLLLPDATIKGELLIGEDGKIACVDASCASAAGYDGATQIECNEKAAISPGLINAHDHISYANNPPHKPQAERYEHRHDWRKGARGHTKLGTTSAEAKSNAVEAAELRFLMSGVTAIAGAGGAPKLVRNLDTSRAQLEGLDLPIASSDTFPLGDSGDPRFPTSCSEMTSSKRKKTSDVDAENAYVTHIAEGVDEPAHAEFVCQSGGTSDADRAFDLLRPQTAVVHGVAVGPQDVVKYRQQKSILVWSPRSNIDLYGNTAPIALYAHLGVPIALGTDWLPSGSMNMARELRCADDLNRTHFGKVLSDQQLWQAVTTNAAFAVGAQRTIGQLKVGYAGDVAIFDGAGAASPWRAVIEAGVEDTVLVLRGGLPLYGDAALVEATSGDGCEDIGVCGVVKKACVKKDTGDKTLADLQAAADKFYPLFACKTETPKDEPSCAPVRGTTASDAKASTYEGPKDGDQDGDGVPDAQDNCPSVFNPIRPMDNGKQGDVDNDGVGDACDKCPLEAGESCTLPDANDKDDDNVPNAADNCPNDTNADQADADKDGKGAVCDLNFAGATCDDVSNPVGQPCPGTYTIAQLRNAKDPAHPKAGNTRAIISGVYVTAVKTAAGSKGFFIQSGTDQFSGMFVATGEDDPKVAIGNKVDVTGNYEEVFDISQISSPVVKVVDNGKKLPFEPVEVDAATYADSANKGASGEPFESMLLAIKGPITVTVKNPDGEKDYDEFAVNDAKLRVDDALYAALDNNYDEGTDLPKLVGIGSFGFGFRKVLPRFASDIGGKEGTAEERPASDGGTEEPREPKDKPSDNPGDDADEPYVGDDGEEEPKNVIRRSGKDAACAVGAIGAGGSGFGAALLVGLAVAARRRRRAS